MTITSKIHLEWLSRKKWLNITAKNRHPAQKILQAIFNKQSRFGRVNSKLTPTAPENWQIGNPPEFAL